MLMENPTSTKDSTSACKNWTNLVQPPKVIGFPPKWNRPFRPLNSHCLHTIGPFNGGDSGEPLNSAIVSGAQHLGPSDTLHGGCLHCRSRIGLIGYSVAFIKGVDTREYRGKQMSSSHQHGPRRERVESRLKKRRYFTRSHQHPTDHGADIGGSVRAHGGDRG